MKTITSHYTDDAGKEVGIVLASDPRYKGNLDALKEHPLYALLTPKQQAWTVAYIETRDPEESSLRSGNFNSNHAARMSGLRNLRDFRIKHLVCEYDGIAPELDQSRMTDRELEHLVTMRLRSGMVADSTFMSMADGMLDLRKWRRAKKHYKPLGKKKEAAEAAQQEPAQDDPFDAVRAMEAARNTTS
jgi:hypothetical protein